ncbi:MAG: OadG family protein [Melioribacteraceae bacterium]|nr:OadG family protein [Melioribacteraceae bacterium]
MNFLIAQITPAAVDSLSKSKIHENADKFLKIDPLGIGITFIGMSVVFLALLLLYIIFFNITKVINKKISLVKKEESKEKKQVNISTNPNEEIYAAIGLALHLHFSELHDKESTVLTINKVARTYSPWSSKIYGLRQFPR